MMEKEMTRLTKILLSILMVVTCFPFTPVLANEVKSELVKTTNTKVNEEVNIGEMTSDELFDYIMSISSDELDALYDQYPNLDELMDNFTEEQQAQLSEKFGNAEENIDTTALFPHTDIFLAAKDATINATISNANVVYYAWNFELDTNKINFKTLNSGKNTISNFTSARCNGYVLFFVKAADNYLFNGLNDLGQDDIYPLSDSTNWSETNIKDYPGFSNVISAAKKQGYKAVFGFHRKSGSKAMEQTFSVIGQQPGVAVTTESDKWNHIEMGDEITFTVKLKPETPVRTTVTDFTVTSATINDSPVEIKDLTKTEDGTWTGTITYTAKYDDCQIGHVDLTVNTQTKYEVNVSAKGQGASITTSATISKSETREIDVVKKSKVQYEFHSSTEGKELPEEVTKLLPEDLTEYEVGKKVTVSSSPAIGTTVDVGDGCWTFTGWNRDWKTMSDSGIFFKGYWEFTQKTGEAGYYLSLNNATWNTSGGISSKTEGDKTEYYYDRKFVKGDTFTVVDTVPTAPGYQFIGWLDKERESEGVKYDATIRKVGDSVTYIYNDRQTYTLDALWASISVTGYEGIYDGQSHTIGSEDIVFNEGTQLDDKYKDLAKSLITEGTLMYSTDNENWSETKPEFADAGEYTVYVKETVLLGGEEVELVGQGTVKINKTEVNVTTESSSKVYDGTVLTASGSIEGLVNDETATLDITGSQTNVGESANTYTLKFAGEEGASEDTTAKRSNYTISDKVGTLKVNAQSIDPNAEDKTTYKGVTINNPTDVIYNGLEQKQEPEVKDVSGNALTNGTDYTVSYSSDTTNVGEVIVTITGIGNYTGTVTRTYNIMPATLYVTTPSATKVYDGTTLTKNEGVSITGFVNNEWADIVATGSQTIVGSSKNTYKVTFADGVVEGGNETSSNTNSNESDIALTSDGGPTALSTNYTIVGTDAEGHDSIGTLTVTEYADEIVVTTTGGTFTYDGAAHGATVSVSELPTGYTLETATSSATVTDVTTTDVTVTCDTLVIKNAANEDVTSKLKITKIDGTISVTPATLYVTTPSDTKVYDGTALTSNEGASVTGFVNNETAFLSVTGTQIAAGSSTNTYSLTWDDTAKSTNYTVSENVGTLTVTSKDITPDDDTTPEEKKTGIVVNDPSNYEYDGNEHKETLTVTDTKTDEVLVEGTDYEVSYSTKDFTNVGTITITVTGKGNYTGSFTKSYEITRKAVEVVANNNGKVYGNADPTLYATKNGVIKGEESLISYNISREAGETVGNYTIEVSGEQVQGNYTVTYTNGTFTIVAKDITPDDKTGIEVHTLDDVKYNGASQAQKPEINDTKTTKTLVEGTDYELTYSEDTTNAGQVTVTITGIGNYTGTYTVTYNILKRDVTFTSPSASKTYDGSALTNTEIAISGEGFVEGEGATFNVTGSVTEVGEVENTFEYTMNEGTNADNYNVTVVNGKLTITAAPVVPSNDTTPVTPVTPTRRTTPVAPNTDTTPTATSEATVEPIATPEATATPEIIEDDETPEVAPKGNWTLIYLIVAVGLVLLGIVLVLYKNKKDKDDEEYSED